MQIAFAFAIAPMLSINMRIPRSKLSDALFMISNLAKSSELHMGSAQSTLLVYEASLIRPSC
jgi:hypothetical protein